MPYLRVGHFYFIFVYKTLINMAFTKRLIETVMQTARSKTSGYQTAEEINRNLAAVEDEILELLVPLYSVNQKVQDLLAPFVIEEPVTITGGVINKPQGYLQFEGLSKDGKPVYPKNTNQITLILTSPVRKPTENGPYYCVFKNNKIYFYPDSIEDADLSFIKKPTPGKIEFEIVETEEEDYFEIKVLEELQWTERAFNLFYYHLLEKFGIEQQNQLSMEYSQLGIQKEISKTV